MISVKVRKLLIDSGIDGLSKDTVFAYKIPQNNERDTHKMQVLLSDISEYPDIEGSDMYRGLEQHLNVKIFFPALSTDDPDVVKNSIIKFLKTKRYRFHDSDGITVLPDSDRTMLSMQFWHLDVLDEAQ